jgi:hypothetical protein
MNLVDLTLWDMGGPVPASCCEGPPLNMVQGALGQATLQQPTFLNLHISRGFCCRGAPAQGSMDPAELKAAGLSALTSRYLRIWQGTLHLSAYPDLELIAALELFRDVVAVRLMHSVPAGAHSTPARACKNYGSCFY